MCRKLALNISHKTDRFDIQHKPPTKCYLRMRVPMIVTVGALGGAILAAGVALAILGFIALGCGLYGVLGATAVLIGDGFILALTKFVIDRINLPYKSSISN